MMFVVLIDFVDLEVFGQNNYFKELNDLQAVFIWLYYGDERLFVEEVDFGCIYLIGYSWGGVILIIYVFQDEWILSLLIWVLVVSLDYVWKILDMIVQWEVDG